MEELVCLTKYREVYNTRKYMGLIMKFHHTNIHSEYNYSTDKADISDQCRSCYRMDNSERFFKWWLDLCVLSFEFYIVNPCIAYRNMCVIIYIMDKKKVFFH